MILRSAPASPFGRKVKIAAALLGLSVSVVEADTASPTDSLRRENPLGKIPTLILEDGTTLFDSAVIVAYLDAVAGGNRLIPAELGPRFAALRLESLADGLGDAALLQVYEGRWRAAEKREAAWVEHQAGKVERALAALEAEPPAGAITVGSIALACALGYLDLRFDGRWRGGHPRLVAWLDGFAAAVPAFEATRVKPA
ncbi:glutathione S-transferase family protein [Lichenibacterium dinghuense]|uniref:glutathione S-transferase family protein n=1 Tax=Lichenibacterium dinghuense TaxID=2895977 RepID=UPI001F1F7A79|nr:glutathione S-transferase family protein [Lichenibacterium sp. 6Y81]